MSAIENPGCLGFLLRLFGGGLPAGEVASPATTFPYRVRDDFLSPTELSFYRVLCTALGTGAVACPKVSLGDVFFVSRPHENGSARNRIDRKHVDFLICELGTMKPLLGVELDDSSHARPDRQARDEFVEQVFAAAKLPLLRVQAQRGYVLQELSSQIEPFLNATQLPTSAPADAVDVTQAPISVSGTGPAPQCPKCGIPMLVRTATQG